jgi:hypothetical protein
VVVEEEVREGVEDTEVQLVAVTVKDDTREMVALGPLRVGVVEGVGEEDAEAVKQEEGEAVTVALPEGEEKEEKEEAALAEGALEVVARGDPVKREVTLAAGEAVATPVAEEARVEVAETLRVATPMRLPVAVGQMEMVMEGQEVALAVELGEREEVTEGDWLELGLPPPPPAAGGEAVEAGVPLTLKVAEYVGLAEEVF